MRWIGDRLIRLGRVRVRGPGFLGPLWVRLLLLGVCLFGLIVFRTALREWGESAMHMTADKKTVGQRVAEFGDLVHQRLRPDFERLGVPYPPARMTLVGLKQERLLEVWVAGRDGRFQLLKSYPILGASGRLGPKLREGDRQVPEGLYRIESLNPNSLYHLALRVSYPNAFDREKGRSDGRTDLGGDIMIHGKTCSVGCLAMGDRAAEDLFVLAAETGIENISVLLSPVDFRVRQLPHDAPSSPAWTADLYDQIRRELDKLKPGT